MSEYFFVIEKVGMPLYQAHEDFEEGASSVRFTFPRKPIPVIAKKKPRGKVEMVSIVLYPEFSISLELYNLVGLQNTYGLNWIPIAIENNEEGQLIKYEYRMLQLANRQDVIDHKQSKYRRKSERRISGMEKVVVNQDKLTGIPLHKRLIFRDSAWGIHIFFHKTIVDQILSFKPSGVEFVPISAFDDAWVG